MHPKRIVLSLLFGSFMLFGGTHAALADEVYTIQLGDSLQNIAANSGCNVEDLKSWNNLQGDALEAGSSLLIKTADPDVTMTRISYTVQQGDTLEVISAKFHISPADVISDNDLMSEDLEVGEVLGIDVPTSLAPAYVPPTESAFIPADAVSAAPVETPAASTPAAAETAVDTSVSPLGDALLTPVAVEDDLVATAVMPTNGQYTVQEGDTLYSIATRYGMDESVLKELNSIDGDTVYAGQALRLTANAAAEAAVTPAAPAVNDFAAIDPEDITVTEETEEEAFDFTTLEKFDWENVDEQSQATQLLQYAMQYRGCPYVYGGTSPAGFDCSGFVQYCFRNALGIDLMRTAADQATEGYEVSEEDLKPGDIIYFASGGYINHVGIYAGGGQLLHASTPSTGVVLSDMNASYYTNNFAGARRIIEGE